MKNILTIPLVGVVIGTLAISTAKSQTSDHKVAPLSLTLDDALNIARTQGNQVKLADMEVVKARYDRRATIAKLFPSVQLTGDYNYTLKKQVMYLGGGFGFPGMPDISDRAIEVGKSFSVTGGVAVGLPLINLPLWSALQLSAEAVQLSILQAEESKEALANQVTKTYYAALLAQESRSVLVKTYENAQKTYEDIKAKYEQGVVAEYDLLRANVALKSIEPNLQQAKNAEVATVRQLLLLLSLDIDQELKLSESMKDKESMVYEGYFSEVIGPEHNRQLKLLDKQIDILKAQERVAKSAFLPTLNVSGFYRYNAMDDRFSWKEYQWTPFSVLAVSLNVPIFSGGEKLAKVKQSKVATVQARLRREELSNSLNAQVLQLKDNMVAATKKMVSAKEAIVQAEKGYEIASKRYDVGMSTVLELNDANLSLLQARLNYFQAIYEYLSNEADYKKVLGIK